MRSLAMIKESDCVLMLNGRLRTLSEFTIALEEGKELALLPIQAESRITLNTFLKSLKRVSKSNIFSPKTDEVLNWLMQESNELPQL